MKKLLILDFLNLFYRGFYTHMDLSHRGIHTGGLFGFIQQLVSHCKEINPSNIVICSDTYPYFRNDDYGDYKQDRRKVDKDKEILEKIQQYECHDEINPYVYKIPYKKDLKNPISIIFSY